MAPLALASCVHALSACNEPRRAPAARAAPLAAASAPASVAPTASAPPAAAELAPDAAELKAVFADWNRATNAGDRAGLEQLYAPRLSLYGRIVSRGEAVKRKLAYVAAHPGFEQRVSGESWEPRGDDRLVRFTKTSASRDARDVTVDAYLLWRKQDGSYHVLDEGDVLTAHKLEAKRDALRASWVPKPYACPACSDPERGDDPPIAGAPLGPDVVSAHGAVPPGAPVQISYGRVIFPRFASAVDVPLFLTATPQSTNGDGRWFYYDAPGAAEPAVGGEPEHLLYCTIGGFWSDKTPANAKPDPGHVGAPKISFTTRLEKRDHELYYERFIYGADGVMNYVFCTFSLQYEAYFYAIVERMGHSLRAVSGGQAERVPRASAPYAPFDP